MCTQLQLRALVAVAKVRVKRSSNSGTKLIRSVSFRSQPICQKYCQSTSHLRPD